MAFLPLLTFGLGVLIGVHSSGVPKALIDQPKASSYGFLPLGSDALLKPEVVTAFNKAMEGSGSVAQALSDFNKGGSLEQVYERASKAAGDRAPVYELSKTVATDAGFGVRLGYLSAGAGFSQDSQTATLQWRRFVQVPLEFKDGDKNVMTTVAVGQAINIHLTVTGTDASLTTGTLLKNFSFSGRFQSFRADTAVELLGVASPDLTASLPNAARLLADITGEGDESKRRSALATFAEAMDRIMAKLRGASARPVIVAILAKDVDKICADPGTVNSQSNRIAMRLK